ncbi:cytochrome P450 [Diaporthe eres]|nr:cytochrome P450 [Diaporthe eres]
MYEVQKGNVRVEVALRGIKESWEQVTSIRRSKSSRHYLSEQKESSSGSAQVKGIESEWRLHSLRGMNLGSQSLRALSHDRNNVTGRYEEIVTGALVSNSASVPMLSLPRTSADPYARSSVGEGEIQLCGGQVDAQAGLAALAKQHQVAVEATPVAQQLGHLRPHARLQLCSKKVGPQ